MRQIEKQFESQQWPWWMSDGKSSTDALDTSERISLVSGVCDFSIASHISSFELLNAANDWVLDTLFSADDRCLMIDAAAGVVHVYYCKLAWPNRPIDSTRNRSWIINTIALAFPSIVNGVLCSIRFSFLHTSTKIFQSQLTNYLSVFDVSIV